MSEALKKALDLIDAEKQNFCEISDKIWDNPETAFLETVSAGLLIDALKAYGFEVTEKLAGIDTAFSGRFGSGKPVIGILGEYDALSGLSQVEGSAVKQAIVDGAPGHGCGHNLLGVGALAAAVGVKKYIEETGCSGTVIFYGCPGEEGGSGKAFMARDGVFDELDCAITWHPQEINSAAILSSLANYQVAYKFKGIAAHAASAPDQGRSALDAVELMNMGVQFLREHIVDSARIHYAITDAGGFSPNVVQPKAEVLYLIRARDNNTLAAIYERVNKIAQGAALMTETELEIDFIKSCSNIVVNTTMSKVMDKSFREIAPPTYTEEEIKFAEEIVASYENPVVPQEKNLVHYSAEDQKFLCSQLHKPLFDFVMPFAVTEGFMGGSTDVGDVSWVCPIAQALVVAKAAGTPGHSWQQTAQGKSSMAHKGMIYAGKIMADTAIKLLDAPEIIDEAKKEHAERLGGGKYQCAIPKHVRPRAIAPKK